MSMMDKIKQMLKGRESQVDRAVDKSGDFIDDKTQGKYKGQVDAAQERLKDEFGTGRDQQQPPPQS
ncbi:antitoxin [Streptomyces himalayensis]|uniref:Antitoxin n=1 Tax=Streptomyces himalayensis subsp. himalayensis TaxID=2756131 RepID=A0A7W0I894_9ACTN|nr:antitoxin [Streptomyces himalayensis]MBA2946085.1 antitoxin [Streptomyces himalayensis subsp. himalayensis]